MIVIVDYGMGNLGSILNMIKRIGHNNVIISSEKKDILSSSKLILPGVGSFDKAMTNLQNLNLIDVINRIVRHDGIPCLGICLGMQLFFEYSEEGKLPGLGWLKGHVSKFKFSEASNLRVPHMGWNEVKIEKSSKLVSNLDNQSRFYFVHSYHVNCVDNSDILFKTGYGYEFISGVEKDNIQGVQFHPEKSHKSGKALLKNFSKD